MNMITSQAGGSVRVSDTTSVNRIFSGRLSYSKGSYLLHMLRWKLGEEYFFQALRNYLNTFGHDYAKTPDLKFHLEAVSGVDLTEYFEDWYYGEGYPRYTITWDQQGASTLLQIDQVTSHPSVDFFEMPVPVVVYGEGRDTTLRLEHTQNGQLFSVPVSFEIDSVRFDPALWLISRNNVVQEGMLSSVSDGLSGDTRVIAYPNPVKGKLSIEIIDPKARSMYRWEVFSNLGEQLARGICSNSVTTLDVSAFPAGMYRLLVSDDNGYEVIGFMKE